MDFSLESICCRVSSSLRLELVVLRVLVDLSSALGGAGLVRMVQILGRSHTLGLCRGVAVKSLF